MKQSILQIASTCTCTALAFSSTTLTSFRTSKTKTSKLISVDRHNYLHIRFHSSQVYAQKNAPVPVFSQVRLGYNSFKLFVSDVSDLDMTHDENETSSSTCPNNSSSSSSSSNLLSNAHDTEAVNCTDNLSEMEIVKYTDYFNDGDNQTNNLNKKNHEIQSHHNHYQGSENNASDRRQLQSIILLNLVAIIWGTQHSVIKMVVEDCDSSAFSFSRFAVAAVIATSGPFVMQFFNSFTRNQGQQEDNINDTTTTASATVMNHDINSTSHSIETETESIQLPVKRPNDTSIYNNDIEIQKNNNNLAWRWGVEMGFWMFLGYAFQAIGLEFTTAQRSGFLLYLNIKLVPFFAYVIFGRNISVSTWLSALTAVLGTVLLSFDGTNYDLNIGDLWTIAAAAASAMFILRLEFASKAVKDSALLNSNSLWVVTFAAFVWCIGDGVYNELTTITAATSAVSIVSSSLDMGTIISHSFQTTIQKVVHTYTSHPFELIYLGGVTTALANYIQTKAQKDISAERASIIYALDPVYGAFFANFLLGEELTQWGTVGAGLVASAAATNAFLDLGDKPKDEQ